jgi:hypothetical protein
MHRRHAATTSTSRLRLKSRLCVSASLRLILFAALFTSACSIPNLSSQECIDAKPAVREFFSFHFGNDMAFSQENLKLREKFITPRLKSELETRQGTADPFTVNSDDVPRAFRVGECSTAAPDRAVYDVLVFWKDDTRTDQRTIKVELQKIGEQWLVDRVSN